jgi:hypothetical protein
MNMNFSPHSSHLFHINNTIHSFTNLVRKFSTEQNLRGEQ